MRRTVGGHAYSVAISYEEQGKLEKGGRGGVYKQFYYLNIALGSNYTKKIKREKARQYNSHTHTIIKPQKKT